MILLSKSLNYHGLYFIYRENGTEVSISVKELPYVSSHKLTAEEREALMDFICTKKIDLTKHEQIG